MHKILLGGVALVALMGQALAGDLPSRKEAPVYVAPAPIFTWTGFYVGAHVGAGFGSSSINDYYRLALLTGISGPQSVSPNGGFGGFNVGYNYQIGSWVLGLDGQFDFGGFTGSGSASYPLGPDVWTLHRSVHANTLGTIGARLGYAIDNFLLYAKGGVAFADWKYADASGDLFCGVYCASSATGSNSATGWFIGAGVDYAFANNWSANIEYRYIDFARQTSYLVQSQPWETIYGSIPPRNRQFAADGPGGPDLSLRRCRTGAGRRQILILARSDE